MRNPKEWGHPGPHPACAPSRRLQQGHVSALAPSLPPSGKRRILRCHTCATPCSETRATVCFALRTSEDKLMMARKMRLVRVDWAGIRLVLGVTEATVVG